MYKYVLYCCDSEGRAFGILDKNKGVEREPDKNMDRIMFFDKKADTNELVMQINMSNMLLPSAMKFPFRVVAKRVNI